MRLDLRFSDRPIESLWCQAVAAFVFHRPDISSGVLLALNEKMSGTLTELVEKGVWTGEKDESFLLAPQNMIRAGKLLFHGLGQSSEYTIPVLEDGVIKLGSALDNMGVDEFGIQRFDEPRVDHTRVDSLLRQQFGRPLRSRDHRSDGDKHDVFTCSNVFAFSDRELP